MSDARIRVRANRATGELEVEGPAAAVAEWWDKLWEDVGKHGMHIPVQRGRMSLPPAASNEEMPEVFGEFYAEFRSDITDVDKMLVAAGFIQSRDPERAFTTKAANQSLLDQNIKVANASQCVRRLIDAKRVFVVSDGKYRVSAGGFEYLNSLKSSD